MTSKAIKMEPLLTAEEVGAFMRFTKPTTYKFLRKARQENWFPVAQVGPARKYRVPRDKFLEWVNQFNQTIQL